MDDNELVITPVNGMMVMRAGKVAGVMVMDTEGHWLVLNPVMITKSAGADGMTEAIAVITAHTSGHMQ